MSGVGTGKEVFVVGDFNIDYLSKKSKAVRGLKAIEREFSLNQLITKATRTTSTTSSLLDHVYTNSERISGSGVVETYISDHLPVYVLIKKKKVIYEKVSFTFRQMRSFSFEKLEDALLSINWDDLYQTEDPDECWDHLYSSMLKVLDDLYPEKTMNNVKKKSEWITQGLFELMKLRDDKFKLAKLTKDPDDWSNAKVYRN